MLNTRLLSADSDNIAQAGEVLRDGGLVVFPTETVYGIGANALDAAAVERIFVAKGRPQDNPLIVHVNTIDELLPLVTDFPPIAKRLAEAFWPGPLTMILPRSDVVPAAVSAGLDTVAVRIPSHMVARQIIAAAGVPIAAPSANVSGRPSPTSAAHCVTDLSGRVDLIIDGGLCEVGVESTVITLVGEKPRILRPGGVTHEQLEALVGEVEIDAAVSNPTDGPVSSPGMKYRHYAPRARVAMVDGDLAQFEAFCRRNREPNMWAVVFEDDLPVANSWDFPVMSYGASDNAAEQGASIFAMLRQLDEKGARTVYIRTPAQNGIGLAVYNRLIRAASFRRYNHTETTNFMIGLTGQTGAGKSLVAEHLRTLGYDVIDADIISREVVRKGRPCLDEIAHAFGASVLTAEGELDRRAVAELVFSNPPLKKQLEDIIFPYVTREISAIADDLRAESRGIFLDGPTLFESGIDKKCAKIVSVTAPESMRLERIRLRDNISAELAEKRIKAQHNTEFFAANSDYIIENQATAEALCNMAEEMLAALDLLSVIVVARDDEYDEILAMYRAAGDNMRERGIDQWDEIYPDCKMLKNDISRRQMYLMRSGGELVAAFVLNDDPNDEYTEVNWKYNVENYAVLHRLCINHMVQGQGWGIAAMLHVHRLAREWGMAAIRLDALEKNPAAMRLYEKLGYEKSGVVYFRKGAFVTYEKLL